LIHLPKKFAIRLNTAFYVFLALIIVSFSLLVFSTRSLISGIADTGLSMYSGVRNGIHSVTSFVSNNVNAFQKLLVVQKEYNELLQSMERYQQLERTAAEINAENNRLREQLEFSKTLRYKYIAAEIIGRDPDNLYLTLVLNKGENYGIKKDMPVIAYQNGMQALVGKIVQVGWTESLVLPLYDTRSFIASRFSQSRYEGITNGLGAADKPLLVQSIDKKAKESLSTGDLLVTSGMGGVYPKDIIIGRIDRINYKDGGTSFDAELTPAIDFSALEYVFVIEKEQDDNSGPDKISEQYNTD